MYSIAIASAISTWLPGILSVIKFKSAPRYFKMFLILMIVGSFNELYSFIVIQNGHSTHVNNNIYVLIESFLLIYFLYNLEIRLKGKKYYGLLMAALMLVWVLESFVFDSIDGLNIWFRIVYSLIIVFLCNSVLATIILETEMLPMEISQYPMWKNPLFLICVGILVYFAFKFLVEIYWLNGFNRSDLFSRKIYMINIYINGSVNLIYAIAILWIPRKRSYTVL